MQKVVKLFYNLLYIDIVLQNILTNPIISEISFLWRHTLVLYNYRKLKEPFLPDLKKCRFLLAAVLLYMYLYTERHKQVAVTSRLKMLLLMGKTLLNFWNPNCGISVLNDISNSKNHHKTELNIKITDQNTNRRDNYHSKYKRKHGWTNFCLCFLKTR